MFIAFRSDFQFHGFAVVIALALQFVRIALIGVMIALGMALQNIPIFLQFILVVSDKLAWSSVTFVLDGNYLQAELSSRDVHISALLVTRVIFLLLPRSCIDRKPGVANVSIFVYVYPAERRVDVHVLVFALLVF